MRLRATDAERARAASAIDAAVLDGRLTWAEHYERYGMVWAAQTRGELGPPLADLGGMTELPQVQRVTAVFAKLIRAVAARTQRVHARATFGAIVLDLTALRPGQEIDVEASSFCGKVVILAPRDAHVVDRGDAALGKRVVRRGAGSGGPVIRVDGRSVLGKLVVLSPASGPVIRHVHVHYRGGWDDHGYW